MHKLLALIATLALLVLGLMFSAVLLVFIVTAGIIAFTYLWWKTRALRRLMREQTSMAQGTSSGSQGITIEGEVIRKVVIKDELMFHDEPEKR